jgi:iron complex outermembrane receptor protein
MANKSLSRRQKLMVFTACGLVGALVPAAPVLAQSAAGAAPVQLAQAIPPSQAGTTTTDVSHGSNESIVVRAQRQVLREKNSPSAVTELGAKAIDQVGVGGSIASLLRQAPSVYVYQQGIGNNEPVLTIRGVRGLEVAQTLDGVPTQDLLNGGSGGYLQDILGGRFNLDQIDGVSIYPGVAYPDRNTFGTIGGTVAYTSKRATNDEYIDVFGSVGSFKLLNEGITINSGQLDGPLGSGDNAPKVLLQYSNAQNGGFVDYTPARFNNFEAAFDKPYNDGLSKFQATVLYNTANGLFTPEPVPGPYTAMNGPFSNYAPNEEFYRQNDRYFSAILKEDHYVDDYLSLGLTAFYERTDSTTTAYENINGFGPSGVGGAYTVNGAAPFSQTVDGFGEEDLYGPGSYFYSPVAYPYNPAAAAPVGSAACPTAVANKFAAAGQTSPCGLNAELSLLSTDTYGIQPRALISPPDIFGISQNIHIGALVAKETSPAGPTWVGATPDIAETPQNLIGGYDGGTQRTIYQGYVQDKIDVLNNTLHITPGVTLEGTLSSEEGSQIFGGTPSASFLASSYCATPTGGAGTTANPYTYNPCDFGRYKADKWDRDVLPFFNVSYDLDKIVPALKGVSVYGSFGNSALFAPTTDFGPNLVGGPPNATLVHMYEGGIKYNTPTVAVSLDYFYQKVDRDFGFFQFQSGPQAGEELYNNAGQREFKGVEAAVTWQVTPEIQLFGNASHTSAHYLVTDLASVTVQEDQFGLVQKGDPVTGIPDWVSTFGVDWTHKSLLRDGDTFSARFEGQYTGHQYTTYDVNGTQNIGTIPGVTPFGTYEYYSVTAGDTTLDPHGGINPFTIFNLDMNYTMPTPELPFIKRLKFDLNLQNIFNQFFYQYYYKQISPTSCGNFTSGPFAGQSKSNYGCTPEFSDGLPGEPFNVTFTVTARF